MILALGVLALSLAVSSGAAAQDLDQRIPAQPGGSLQVDLDLGEQARPERVSLEVRSHDADEVWAVADLSGLGASTVKFRVEHDENVVRVYARAGGIMSWLLGGPGVAVRIWVPREFSIDVRSASGPIRIEDVKGSIRARTTDASIDVRGTDGSLQLRTGTGAVRVNETSGDTVIRATDGAIELEWIRGSVEARTGSGDIRLRQIDGPVRVRTDSGEIQLREVSGPANALTERGAVYAMFSNKPEGDLETRNGSVVVVMPDHAGAQLDAVTGQGTVEIAPALTPKRRRKPIARYAGPLNGGGPRLRVYTARGTIRVDQR